TRKVAKVKVPTDAAVGSRVPVPLAERGAIIEKPLGEASVIVGEFPEKIVNNGQATTATPGTANGIIGKPGEMHLIRLGAKKGQRLIIETNARRIGSPLDSVIEVLDTKGKPVGRATLRSTARTFVVFRDHDSASPGIRIENWNELAMDDYIYVG